MFINPQSEYYIVSKVNNMFNTTQDKGFFPFPLQYKKFNEKSDPIK